MNHELIGSVKFSTIFITLDVKPTDRSVVATLAAVHREFYSAVASFNRIDSAACYL